MRRVHVRPPVVQVDGDIVVERIREDGATRAVDRPEATGLELRDEVFLGPDVALEVGGALADVGLGVGVAGRGDADLVSKKVDDVTYTWGNPYAMAEGVLYSVQPILDSYLLPRLEFL